MTTAIPGRLRCNVVSESDPARWPSRAAIELAILGGDQPSSGG